MDVRLMSDGKLVRRWLACERVLGDPMDAAEYSRAYGMQLQIEVEQNRRRAGGRREIEDTLAAQQPGEPAEQEATNG